jgi:hypothetical protein
MILRICDYYYYDESQQASTVRKQQQKSMEQLNADHTRRRPPHTTRHDSPDDPNRLQFPGVSSPPQWASF